jgi:NADH:ubiquinone oxidoreductase subunit K
MNLTGCLVLSASLFGIGAFGLLTRRNMIAALMSLELMVNAALINFVAFARFGNGLAGGAGDLGFSRDPESGSMFALFAVGVTAAEMALALAIVIALHRRRKSLDLGGLERLHG